MALATLANVIRRHDDFVCFRVTKGSKANKLRKVGKEHLLIIPLRTCLAQRRKYFFRGKVFYRGVTHFISLDKMNFI